MDTSGPQDYPKDPAMAFRQAYYSESIAGFPPMQEPDMAIHFSSGKMSPDSGQGYWTNPSKDRWLKVALSCVPARMEDLAG